MLQSEECSNSEDDTEYYKADDAKKVYDENYPNLYVFRHEYFNRQNETRNKFIVTSNPLKYKQFPESCHEVIYGDRPQRLYFDFDKEIPPSDDFKDLEKKCIILFLKGARKVFEQVKILPYAPFIFSSSYEKKISIHVVFMDSFFSDSKHQRFFFTMFKSEIDAGIGIHLDTLYKKVQSYRAPLCNKWNQDVGVVQDRTKRPLFLDESYFTDWTDPWMVQNPWQYDDPWLVTFIPEYALCIDPIIPSSSDPSSHMATMRTSTDTKCVEYLCALEGSHPSTYTIREQKYEGSLSDPASIRFLLHRNAPSKCCLCNRQHDSDAGYIVYFPKSRRYVFSCFRYTSDHPDKKGGYKVIHKESVADNTDDHLVPDVPSTFDLVEALRRKRY